MPSADSDSDPKHDDSPKGRTGYLLLLLVLICGIAAAIFDGAEKQRQVVQALLNAQNEQAIAEESRRQTEVARQAAEAQQVQADVARRQAQLDATVASQQAANARRELYRDRIALAKQLGDDGDLIRANEILEKCHTADRQWEWHYLKRLFMQTVATVPIARESDWSRDGRWFAAVSDEGLRIFDGFTFKEHSHLLQGERMRDVGFSPDSTRLVATSPDAPPRIFDVETGRRILVMAPPNADANRLAWSSDETAIALGDSTGIVRIYNAADGKITQTFAAGSTIISLEFHPTKPQVLIATEATISLWEWADAVRLWEQPSDGAAVALSPTGEQYAQAAGAVLRVARTADHREIRQMPIPRVAGQAASWSRDGTGGGGLILALLGHLNLTFLRARGASGRLLRIFLPGFFG
ncbi:MAG: hypothetical protein ACI8W8_004140, partial [Rhodothermales bacterium]